MDLENLAKAIEARLLSRINDDVVLDGLLGDLVSAFEREHPSAKLFVSGGVIRDIAVSQGFGLDLPVKDLDLVIEGASGLQVQTLLEELSGTCEYLEWFDRVGVSFPVWKLKPRNYSDTLDLALTRTEASLGPGHRDFHLLTEGGTVEEDSMRRDFTMNSLYIALRSGPGGRLRGSLFDFHDGLRSILQREIRCVGNPLDRFIEDPLRVLRAIRFEAKLGFRIEEKTSAAMREALPRLIGTVAMERIADELYRSLLSDPDLAIAEFANYGILDGIFPEIAALPKDALERTSTRIKLLQSKLGSRLDAPSLFAAFMEEAALAELESKMHSYLCTASLEGRFFDVSGVASMARQAKLPAVKRIERLCTGVLLLIHYLMLRNPDAVVERLLRDPQDSMRLLALYTSNQESMGVEVMDFQSHLEKFPCSSLDFRKLVEKSGIPFGPHLYEMKLALRQAEIDERIRDEKGARELIDWLYASDVHLISEHVNKVRKTAGPGVTGGHAQEESLRALSSEIRWLLFTRPFQLLKAYHDQGVLEFVFPELAEADRVVEESDHHFAARAFNDVLLALSILHEEVENPTPLQLLSVIFLDVGKPKAMKVQANGKTTYYSHEVVGAEMSRTICSRLGIGESLASDLYFIIRNHNALILGGGPDRIRRLLFQVDHALIEDLLLVHKIDQKAKMRIEAGRRVDEGQLANYNYILGHLDSWKAEIEERRSKIVMDQTSLLTGEALKAFNPAWGPGLPEGPEIGRLKRRIVALQQKGIIQSTAQAVEAIRGQIILYHMSRDRDSYIQGLAAQGLLAEIMPEIAALVGLAQDSSHHKEDAFAHTLKVVGNLPLDASAELIMAALFHDAGKPLTRSWDEGKRVFHFFNHEEESEKAFRNACARLGWSNDEFNLDAVCWLIRNHQKVHLQWKELNNPKRTIRRIFGGEGFLAVSSHTQADLIALAEADIRGATPASPEITENKLMQLGHFGELMREVAKMQQKEQGAHEFEKTVKMIWNGHSVLRYFRAEGSQIGRLVHLGQEYVRAKLSSGEGITEELVREYLADKGEGSSLTGMKDKRG